MTSSLKNDQASITVYTDPFNKRIRIDDYSGHQQEVLELIISSIPAWTEKLIVKTRDENLEFFQRNGFSKEAYIEGYFNGADMHFLTRYFTPARAYNPKQADEDHMVEKIVQDELSRTPFDLNNVLLATSTDAEELALLYSSIFKVYPTPLGDSSHIRKTMEEGTVYAVIREQNKIVSVASAEINRLYSNAELTDCATLPEAEGKGLMKKLLSKLEEVLTQNKIHCLYTIARAESYSMNKAFHQLNFTYGGRLINNCFIYSGLEDMNVWYKLVTA